MKNTILAVTLGVLTTSTFATSYIAQTGASCEALEPLQQIGLTVNDAAGGVQVDLIHRAHSIPAGSYVSFQFNTAEIDANQVAHFQKDFYSQYNSDERDIDRYQFDLDLSQRDSGIVVMKHYAELFTDATSNEDKDHFISYDEPPCGDIIFKRMGG